MNKKRVLLSIFFAFLMTAFILNVNAAETIPHFGIDLRAKAPNAENLPSASTELKAATSDNFDFSKIKFSKSGSTSETIDGTEHLRKIIIGKLKSGAATKWEKVNITPTSGTTISEAYANSIFGDDWFTAYCLDNSMDYPYFGLFSHYSFPDLTATLTAEQKIEIVDKVTRIAFFNDDNMKAVISRAESLLGGHPYHVTNFIYASDIASSNRSQVTEAFADSVIAALQSGAAINIKISGVYFHDVTTGASFIFGSSADQVHDFDSSASVNGYLDDSNHNLDFVTLSTNYSKIAFHNYNATKPSGVKNYNQALWIVEHSYPTLNLSTSLALAGTSYDAVKAQVKSIYGIADSETDRLEQYTENVVFGVVQYAIWKVTGTSVYGNQLGNSIQNSTELTKLFQYLTENKANVDFDKYANPSTFDTAIDVLQPKEENKLFRENSDSYIYGPFTAVCNAITSDNAAMTVNILNTDKTGISVLDVSENEVTSINNDGKGNYKFFIKVDKKVKPTKIDFELVLENAITFSPSSNRGRIYYPLNATKGFQNAMSGGKTNTLRLSVEDGFTIKYVENPKTGVENIALLLMITLVAFTLGYLVLNYKSKPIQLNQ